jgi:hypothetical protein
MVVAFDVIGWDISQSTDFIEAREQQIGSMAGH